MDLPFGELHALGSPSRPGLGEDAFFDTSAIGLGNLAVEVEKRKRGDEGERSEDYDRRHCPIRIAKAMALDLMEIASQENLLLD
jgi:hypothetical protein